MANYLYNGVELPDINSVWTDKETYPYAVIEVSNGEYILNLTSTPTMWQPPSADWYTQGTVYEFYVLMDGKWFGGEENSLNGVAETDRSINDIDTLSLVWSNHDVLNESDSTVCLYASEPVPVWKKCLYNGVELVDIDLFWTDKTTYPYAVMFKQKTGVTEVYLTSQPLVVFSDGKFGCTSAYKLKTYFVNDSDYSNFVNASYTENETCGDILRIDSSWGWANYNVLDVGGNTILPTSPIPTVVGNIVENEKCTYNNVELPDINTVWVDKTAYPYVTIGKFGSAYYVLALSEKKLKVDSSSLFYPTDTCSVRTYFVGELNNSYVMFENEVKGVDDLVILFAKDFGCANYDVLEDDGTVYIAKSDSIPEVGSLPVITESSGDGYAFYNGAKLLNVDSVWTDKTTYPYADIQKIDYTLYVEDAFCYVLTLSTIPLIHNGTALTYQNTGTRKEIFFCPTTENANAVSSLLETTVEAGEWCVLGESECLTSTSLSAEAFCWFSYDVLNTDGTTYLSASEPIPLDGMTVVEWNGGTSGLTHQTAAGILGATMNYYKVSDTLLTEENAIGSVYVVYSAPNPSTYYEGGRTCSVVTESNIMPTSGTTVNIDYAVHLAYNGIYFNNEGGTSWVSLYAFPTAAEPEQPKRNKRMIWFMGFLLSVVRKVAERGDS